MDRYSRAGLTFPVRDEGPPDGEPVVLLHGFPQDASAYDGVVPLLHAQGLRTLAPTQRGYAPTARPQARRDYRTEETAGDVVALLDAAGLERAHVVGHDWGAMAAWGVAAFWPERVASLTVLSTPHPSAMVVSLVTSSQPLKSWYMGFFQLPVVAELAVRASLGRTLRTSGLPERYAERYLQAMKQPGAVSGALGWYRGMPFSNRPLGSITVPTTYVWGRQDFALGRVAAERTARYVDGPYRFEAVDAGHWLPETQPAAVAAAVLDRVADARR